MEQIEELKSSYYEYVNKIADGCQMIAKLIRKGEYEQAFNAVVDFAEGIEWLLTVEKSLEGQGQQINSRLNEANDFLLEINTAFEQQDIVTIADLFEYEIQPLFSSASEWIFKEQ
ncbi:MAG: hypothetical protein ABS949_17425 [Solibacillus sp.]